MQRAKELAQRGMKSLSKEEVERIEEKATQLDELSKKTMGSYVKKASSDLASSIHGERDAEENGDEKERKTQAKRAQARMSGLERAGRKIAKEEVETVSEDNHAMAYVNATLAVMDESKYDDLQDKLRAKRATQSAYDKDYKQDKCHPSISLHKGTSYGGQAQKDDEGDEKPEVEKEKRGRGRPHGSKSGARQKGNGREDGGIPVHNLHLPNRNK
jgi:hypothetical protein